VISSRGWLIANIVMVDEIPEWGLNEIIGETRAIEGGAYWIALVVSWMDANTRISTSYAQYLPDH
jgi:hypothetical protein